MESFYNLPVGIINFIPATGTLANTTADNFYNSSAVLAVTPPLAPLSDQVHEADGLFGITAAIKSRASD